MKAEAIALITLCAEGVKLLAPLVTTLPGTRLYIHESVPDERIREAPGGNGSGGSGIISRGSIHRAANRRDPGRCEAAPAEETPVFPEAERFTRIADLTASLFPVCRGLVYAAPCGVVVRAIAPLIRNKYEDPAVVCIDAGGRWAVSLLSGHEGGANSLAIRIANLLGAEPVITTTTEALKSVIVGIGCRRGTPSERIVAAVRTALADAGIALDEVRLIASADVKTGEAGLLAAAVQLGVPIRFIGAAEIRACLRDFSHSDFVKTKVNLPAVAEPAALLAGRRTQFISRKRRINGITISLAREGFSWSVSAPETR
jgi:cobalt-precorrin 5A hydrolase